MSRTNNCPPCAAAALPRQKYKGVENFLRRLAFNLGNSPSETEVKIISCIPIDVTDLQQRIATLERQLEEAQAQTCPSRLSAPCVHAALVRHALRSRSSAGYLDGIDGSGSRETPPAPTEPAKTTIDKEIDNCHFKKKKPPKVRKQKEHLVYFAEATTSPFLYRKHKDRKIIYTESKQKPVDEPFSSSYLSSVVRRQYAAVRGRSSAGQLSAPTCRDTAPPSEPRAKPSCSYGNFQDLDQHYHNTPYVPITKPALPVQMGRAYEDSAFRRNNQSYYDDRLYDVIPVKERETKKNHPKMKSSVLDAMENMYRRPPQRVPRVEPFIVNYHTYVPEDRVHHHKKMSRKEHVYSKRHHSLPRYYVDDSRDYDRYYDYGDEPSNSCVVECGDVYKKRQQGINFIRQPNPRQKIKLFNFPTKRSTNEKRNTECQVTNAPSLNKPEEVKKTEETLNQIKSILQTVLNEVKHSSLIQQSASISEKKDAVVQKGASQGNMQTYSSYMNCYDYGSFNMGQFPAAAYRGMDANVYSMPYAALRCAPHVPLMPPCAACGRAPPPRPPSPPPHRRPAPRAVAATNTDDNADTETQKLIKEIYKSMALNIKNNSDTIYKCATQKQPSDIKAADNRDLQSVENALTNEVDKKKIITTVMDVPNMSKMYSSATASGTTGSKTGNKSETEDAGRRRRRPIARSSEATVTPAAGRDRGHRRHAYRTQSSSSESESEATEDTATASVAAPPPREKSKVQAKTTVKKGIFTKMKSMFNKEKGLQKKQIAKKLPNKADEEESSDSDYQTIDSVRAGTRRAAHNRQQQRADPARGQRDARDQKAVTISPEHARYNRSESARRLMADSSKYRPAKTVHSKVRHFSPSYRDARQYQERSRRAQLEQEYRRKWAEKVAQQKAQQKGINFQHNAVKSPYYQTVEARYAAVHCPQRSPTVVIKKYTEAPTNVPPSKPPQTKAMKTPGNASALGWLKRHNVKCGKELKKILLES